MTYCMVLTDQTIGIVEDDVELDVWVSRGKGPARQMGIKTRMTPQNISEILGPDVCVRVEKSSDSGGVKRVVSEMRKESKSGNIKGELRSFTVSQRPEVKPEKVRNEG